MKHDDILTLEVQDAGTLITEGFRHGIADVYQYASESGFTTTGIHPSVALHYPKRHYLSPFVDQVFFVSDETWGGWLDQAGQRSPTPRGPGNDRCPG